MIAQHIPEAESYAKMATVVEPEGYAMGGVGGSVNIPTGAKR